MYIASLQHRQVWGDYVFSETNIQAIYVPTGSVEAYKAASYWKNYANKIKGYDF